MIAAAIFQAFDAVGIVYTGALRGAGDTLWPGVMTIVCSWGLIVGVGWLLVKYRPDMASTGPWIGATAYIILLSLMMCWRFERGPWRTRRLVRHAGTAGTH
jgi:MATE family multidrug resistance protein